MCCVGSPLSSWVKVYGAAQNVFGGIQDFGGASGAGTTFAEKERTTTPAIPRQRHVKSKPRALGMRAVISSFRSSRRYLRQDHRPAQCISLQRACLTTARRHATDPRLRRPLSLAQDRQVHSHLEEPTIYALSTASGKAAIAIIRISGPACRQVRLETINIDATCNKFTPPRSTKRYVPRLRSQNRDMRPCAGSTPLTSRRRPPPCSTRAPLSSTSQVQTPSQARICSSCMYMEALP